MTVKRLLIKSVRYPNLVRDKASDTFFFRKYSKEKGRQFFLSTGEKKNEAAAYKLGVEKFNAWLDRVTDEQGVVVFRKYAMRYLKRKLANPALAPRTKTSFQNQLEPGAKPLARFARPRLLEAFGHLKLDQITNDRWESWIAEVSEGRPGFKFFNARKALLEILHDACENGYLKRVPKLELMDEDAAPPREFTEEEIRQLFKAVYFVEKTGARGRPTRARVDARGFPVRRKSWIKLLMLIMWKQGARPREILQYEWAMLKLEEGTNGKIQIPGRITKTRRSRAIALNPQVARMLRFLEDRRAPEEVFLFPSPQNPSRPIQAYLKTWWAVCERAGVTAQMYWFRDTFVSRKLREGVSPVFIAGYLDTSVGMLERKYAVADDATQEKVAK